MKTQLYTRLASFMLAIGFFLGCSSSAPSIQSYIDTNQYDRALAAIQESLLENPDQPDLLIHRGEINIILANGELAEERSPFYEITTTSFNEALEFELNEEQIQNIDQQIFENWQREFNTGTAIYEDATADDRYTTSIAHFENAVLLNPTDSRAYISLSVANYANNDLEEAIRSLNSGKNTVSDVPELLYENLGFLYLQSGDPDQAVFYYELANTNVTTNKNIAFGLVNAYLTTSSTEKAIDLLGTIVENYPYDADVRNVYGTQLYQVTLGILNDLVVAYNENDASLIPQLKFEAEGIGEQAEKELIEAYQLESTNIEYMNSLAVFYNNLTAQYLALTEVAFEQDKAGFEERASILLDLAIQYY
ncbi:MAG: tetratricopeptide repeat protein, partial [Balneolales bacterium]|nr:tetratricopeptide repeat protein [Balneolales bacterium]